MAEIRKIENDFIKIMEGWTMGEPEKIEIDLIKLKDVMEDVWACGFIENYLIPIAKENDSFIMSACGADIFHVITQDGEFDTTNWKDDIEPLIDDIKKKYINVVVIEVYDGYNAGVLIITPS